MKKNRVKIVVLGNLRHGLDLKKINKHKSKFFEITGIEEIQNLPEPEKDDYYLDVVYSRDEIAEIMKKVKDEDLVVGIINYGFSDNFYLHRVGENKVCISIAYIDHILIENNISIENFILKNIYEITAIKDSFSTLTSEDVYELIHLDTRGCLFDMNGNKVDIVYNTEKSKVCDSCKAFLNGKSLPEKYVYDLEKELKRIKKPFFLRV